MTRKIISVYPITMNMGTNSCVTHSALCDDGTLWIFNPYNAEWALIPNVPQDTLAITGAQGTYAAPSTATPISTAS